MELPTILERSYFLPAKSNGRKFPALAGITTNAAGNFATWNNNQQAEFCLNNHLARETCGNCNYHKLIPDHEDKIGNARNCGNWWHGDGFWDYEKDFLKNKKIGESLFSITADCPTVVISSLDQSFISIVHSGWRGTEKKISAKAIAIARGLGIPCSDLTIGLFPGICGQCYDVGPEMAKIFPGGIVGGKLDLRGVILSQLLDADINADQIFIMRYCSYETKVDGQPIFQSVRRNKTLERNAVFIVRTLT